MKRKNQFSTSNKYWLLILAIICIVLMGLSGFAESGKGPLSWAAGYTIVPMQKGINRVGMWIGDVSENFATLQEIKKENKELKSRLEEMTTENNRLQQNSATLERYKELYKELRKDAQSNIEQRLLSFSIFIPNTLRKLLGKEISNVQKIPKF